jgi:hypothetical protein
MPGIGRRRRQQAEQFARKLAGWSFCEPESLLEFCNVIGCEARFVANERQRRLLALGKRLCCDFHRHSIPDQPRPGRTIHQFTPRLDNCDGCGKPFVARPRALVLSEMRHARLLCDSCCAAWQHATIAVCPCCGLKADCAAFRACSIGGCVGQAVEIRQRSIPALVANPIPLMLWQIIVARSAGRAKPGRFRTLAVTMCAVLQRRGKSQRWLRDGQVSWR